MCQKASQTQFLSITKVLYLLSFSYLTKRMVTVHRHYCPGTLWALTGAPMPPCNGGMTTSETGQLWFMKWLSGWVT